MASLTIKINGYAYVVSCGDGEEAHLQAMAQQIEDKIDVIKGTGNQSGESRLLVMAALLLADDLHDARAELSEARRGGGPRPRPAPEQGRLRNLAQRAEEIAAGLERP